MAVAFDVTSSTNSGSSSVSTLSFSPTIGAALSSGAIVACLYVQQGTQLTSPAITWNGVSMGLIALTTKFNSGAGTINWFGLVNPAGGSHSLAASWTGAGQATLGFMTFSGVDQTGGATTFINGANDDNAGATANRTKAITTVSGNASVFGWGVGAAFSGAQTPTQDWQVNTAGFAFAEGQHRLSVSTSDSYTAVLAAADEILGSGFSIKAAAAGGAVRQNIVEISQARQRASYW